MAGSQSAVLEDVRAQHATSSLAERVGRRYLVYLLLLPLVAYIYPFVAERTPLLERLNVSRWGQMLDYLYTLKGTNADVLIFGDSSAYFDEDTVKISHDLGIKVINIPHNAGSLPILQDRMLRRYLAENRPPRLIVFHFTAWDMNFKTAKNPYIYDGIELLVRHGSAQDLLDLFRRYPSDTMLFPFRFYRIPNRISSALLFKKLPEVAMIQGHTLNTGTAPLPPNCTIPNSLLTLTDTQSVQEAVHDFTTPQTKTLVYFPALPACTNAEQTANRPHPGLSAMPPKILPTQIFVNDNSYTHALPAGVDQTTLVLEGAIQKALQEPQQR